MANATKTQFGQDYFYYNFVNLVYTSDFAVRCDLDRNNPAQIIPHLNFKNRSISVLKQHNRLKNNF